MNNPGKGIAGEDGVFTFTTMAELLQHSGRSWKYYDEKPDPHRHTLWNPLPGFKAIAGDPKLMAHLVSLNEFDADARAGRLPEVCWVVPRSPTASTRRPTRRGACGTSRGSSTLS